MEDNYRSNDDSQDDDYSNYDNDRYNNEYENFEPDDNGYPEDENFNQSIIYLDEPLRYIINNMEINVVHAGIKVNLLNYLPLFKQGYTTKDDLIIIFAIDQYLHDIDPYTYLLYLKAFGGELPDNYFDLYRKYDKSMPILTDELFLEHNLIERLHQSYHLFKVNIDGDIILENFLFNMNTIQDYDWVNLLLMSELKLYAAVILGYEFAVEEYLIEVDPRDHNNEAYHLAVKGGNQEIIDLIKNKIIELNWLDKQALIKQFNKYDFLSDDIIRYYQSRKYL